MKALLLLCLLLPACASTVQPRSSLQVSGRTNREAQAEARDLCGENYRITRITRIERVSSRLHMDVECGLIPSGE